MLENGTIAGSTLKLNQGFFNFITQTGLPIEEAIRFVTENPAKYLGLDHLYGTLDEGKYADFTITDTQLNVFMTIREGEMIYEKKD